MVVKLVGSVIEASDDLWNAESPIVVTGLPSIEDGTVTELGHVALQPVTVAAPPLTEYVRTVSTVQEEVAAELVLPAASVALTERLWAPSDRPESSFGEEQAS
jgi:hypothetical protein